MPQGAVLGPILFLLYVNDFSNVIKGASINVYADDVVIYASHANIDMVRTNLQAAINEVTKWYSTNLLQLSAEKCVSIAIHHNRLGQIPDLLINLNTRTLKQVHEVKYLGLIIDDRLKWEKHLKELGTIKRFYSVYDVYYGLLHFIQPSVITKCGFIPEKRS